jgi:hypothetical protein
MTQGRTYRAVFERVEVVGLAVKSHKHGRYLRMVVEIPLIDEVDVNGLAHELYESPSRMSLEKLQTSLPVEVPAEAAG